jgi:hypothetical protein
MIIEYDIHCHERTLLIKFPRRFEHLEKDILEYLDAFYIFWHDAESIEDPEERAIVMDSCCEEFMMDRLSETYNMWEWWDTDYYGDDEEEMYETVPVFNPEFAAKMRLSQDLMGAELITD